MKRVRYSARDLIGAGSSSEVYRARMGWSRRVVAVKALSAEQSADSALAVRLQNEAATLASLQHDNIVRLHGVTLSREGRLALVMEYVKGCNLSELVPGGRLMPGGIVHIGCGLLRALAHGHERGLSHRDVSPRNVLISSKGEVKLADYGLARTIGRASASSNHAGGTMPYMAPEQALGMDVDTRADLFAVGVLLYKLATGRVPFEGKTEHAILSELLQWRLPDAEGLPPALAPVILKLLAGDPDERYQTAGEALADLADLADLAGLAAMPEGRDEILVHLRAKRLGLRRPRWGRALSVALLVVAAMAIGGAGVYFRVAGSSAGDVAGVDGAGHSEEPASAPETHDLGQKHGDEKAGAEKTTPRGKRHRGRRWIRVCHGDIASSGGVHTRAAARNGQARHAARKAQASCT